MNKNTVTKTDIEEAVYVALERQVPKRIIKAVVTEVFETILLELVKGKIVSIFRFGNFKAISKTGTVPTIGKYSRFIISFKTSYVIKKKLNQLKGFIR